MYDKLDNYIGELISYKVICEETGIKYYSGGKSKQLQLDDVGRFYELEKVKTKYMVVAKREIPIEKEDKRKDTLGNNSKYADDIETVMLYTLQNKKEFVCTISQALLLCNLVNKNYAIGRKNIPVTSEVLNIDIKNVYMFYDNTSRKLKGAFERALNRMRNKALLSYNKPIRVAYNDIDMELNELGEPKLDKHNRISYSVNEVHRDATKEEIEIILESEANALMYLNCIDKQQVFLQHLWNKFCELVTKEVSDRLNIKYYYEAYDITVNTKHVDRTIKRYEMNGASEILNYNMLDSLVTSIDKASEKVNDDGEIKYSKKFISDTKVMIETTINSSCKYDLNRAIRLHRKNKTSNDAVDDNIPF